MVLGYAAIVMASLVWSLNPAIISRFRRSIKPATFTAVRALFALLFLLPAVLLRGVGVPEPSPRALLVILLSAVAGPGLGDMLYTMSIQRVGGSLAVMVGYTYIFVAQAAAVLAVGEPLRYAAVAGSVSAFLGIVVATLGEGKGVRLDPRGIACAAAAALLWGAATIMVREALEFVDTLSLTFIRLIIIASLFLPTGLLLEGLPGRTHLRPFLVASSLTGILGWGIGMYLFVYSVGTIGVSATVVATAITPVLSQALVRLLAGERPGPRQLVGASLISLGVLLTMV